MNLRMTRAASTGKRKKGRWRLSERHAPSCSSSDFQKKRRSGRLKKQRKNVKASWANDRPVAGHPMAGHRATTLQRAEDEEEHDKKEENEEVAREEQEKEQTQEEDEEKVEMTI